MWDIGGQRKIRPYWRNYFDNTDVLVSDTGKLPHLLEISKVCQNIDGFCYFSVIQCFQSLQIYVVDSADKKRMEESYEVQHVSYMYTYFFTPKDIAVWPFLSK